MKTIVRSKEEVKVSGDVESHDFKISKETLPHLLKLLRSDTYSNPILAPIREYWANARDSVVEAGKDPSQHVFIEFPSAFSDNFVVRDEGIGLSDDEIKDIFSTYGVSTKRDSNDPIGLFGIGCKSAFAYTDAFTIRSIKDNVENVYVASVARDSVESVGKVYKTFTKEYEEDVSNGLSIEIPVKDSDKATFLREAAKLFYFVNENEFPVIKSKDFHKQLSLLKESYKSIYKKEGEWELFNYSRTSFVDCCVVMGGIPYSFNESNLTLLTEDEKNAFAHGVIVYADIGDIEISMSRETVRYTDYTQKKLKKVAQDIQKTISKHVEKELSGCKNIIEAKYKFQELSHFRYLLSNSNFSTPAYSFSDLASSRLFECIRADSPNMHLGEPKVIFEQVFFSYSNRIKKTRTGNISDSILTRDKGTEKNFVLAKGIYSSVSCINQRIRAYLEEEKVATLILIRYEDDVSLKKFLDKYPNIKFNNIKDYKPKRNNTQKTKEVKALKHTGNGSILKTSNWKKATELKDFSNCSGIYVELVNSCWISKKSGERHPKEIPEFIRSLWSVGLLKNKKGEKVFPPIFGVKRKYIDEVNKNNRWIHLEDYINRKLEIYVKENKDKLIYKFIDKNIITSSIHSNKKINLVIKLLDYGLNDDDVCELKKIHNNTVSSYYERQHEKELIMSRLGSSHDLFVEVQKKEKEVKGLFKKIINKYPLLDVIDVSLTSSDIKFIYQKLVEYTNSQKTS